MKGLHIRMSVVLLSFIISVILIYPTFEWYTKSQDEREKLEAMKERPKHILNLGLDLRGGTQLLLELEVDKLEKKEKIQDALQRAIEIIRNRVDAYGISEVPIAKVGEKWINVELPGISKTEQAESLIGKTALLEFMLVDESSMSFKIISEIENENKPVFDKEGNLLPEFTKKIPSHLKVLRGKTDEEGRFKYYVLQATVQITGAYLESARVDTDQFGMPTIAFSFNKEGGKIFEKITANNIGKKLAIVLDNIVYTAPVIKSEITMGKGVIEGNFTMEEARNIALILRSGALPAPVKIIEKRVVGPTLGEDSIKKGLNASIIGLLLVFVFIIIYYRGGGIVASIGMIFNLVILIGVLSYFGATLTLPGIAGIILSIAMAVDANVLILERMREESEINKPLPLIISTAYSKAWSAIFDSNLTTWITSVFLFQFGSGPVKGFATTLTIGLVVGVFTSVYVTRTIYEMYLTSNPKSLSI
ncbi:MAG: protein translocase subunit SecD [Elusimicrobiales bacterium]|nr:protein translocase subunit SecD [Elusimicrobiales bacterium]